jgi:hypothetical protein
VGFTPREGSTPSSGTKFDQYTAWRAACQAVGIERIPHDFRRTAVRNFERAGVPRTTAMAMVGHKTKSIYRRHSIVDQAMLEVGASKLDQLQQAQGLSKPVVVSIKRKRSNDDRWLRETSVDDGTAPERFRQLRCRPEQL